MAVEWRPLPGITEKERLAWIDSDYAKLDALAHSGYSVVARELNRIVWECANIADIPKTRAESEQAVEALRQSRSIPSAPGTSARQLLGDEEIGLRIDILAGSFERCQEARALPDHPPFHYLELAASFGDTVAMMDLSNVLVGKNPSRSYALLEAAWTSGDWHALGLLSASYRRSFERGEEPSADGKAGASYLAHYALAGAAYGNAGIRPNQLQRLRSRAEKELAALRPHERGSAVLAATRVVEENPACCMRN